jgi:plastocyanin
VSKKTWSLGSLFAALLVWLGLGARPVPAAPVVRAVAGADSLIVSWSAPANSGSAIDGYRVTVRSDGQSTGAPVTVPGLRFAWAIAGVAPGQTVTLTVTVEAHNAKGYGPPGAASLAYTAADLVPGAPAVQLQVKPTP